VSAQSEANKKVVWRYFNEWWNERKVEICDEIFGSEFELSIPTHGGVKGQNEMRSELAMLHTAFPDIHFYVEDLFADDERVAARWVARGTHLGDFLGYPPSGRRFWVEGIGSYRLTNGKLVENLVNEDSLNLLIQVGVIQPPTAREG
jgi:steroid delta-isomerase-like uncharacterized protein